MLVQEIEAIIVSLNKRLNKQLNGQDALALMQHQCFICTDS